MPTADEIVSLAPHVHAVLVAGPGAGKTWKITERVAALRAAGVARHEITVLTLTRETRRTLRKRVPDVPASTVHAYVLARLNEMGDASGKKVANEWETEELLSRDVQRVARLRGVRVDLRRIKKFLRRLGTGFRRTQLDEATLTPEERQVRDAFLHVRRFLVLRTFEELAQDCVQLLQTGYQLAHLPKALVVDEYQDLTAAELKLISLIAGRAGAGVFACGDDRQAIYGFREADPHSLSNFGIVYGTEPTFMSRSYRCPRAVVDLSEAIARRMPTAPGLVNRPPLECHPDRTDPGRVRIATFVSMWAEAEWVSAVVQGIRTDAPGETVMIIVPREMRGYVRYLNDASEQAGRAVRFVDSRGMFPFQEEDSYRIWLAILRLVEDPEDQLAWRTLLLLVRGVGGDTMMTRLYQEGAATLTAALRARDALDAGVRRLRAEVASFVDQLRDAPDADAVIAILQTAAAHWGSDAPAALWPDICAAPIDDELPEPSAEEVAWKVVLRRCQRAAGSGVSDAAQPPHVVMAYTVFQSKGQEADHVFLMGAHAEAFQQQDVAQSEGLRQVYVAITRSIRTLTVTLPRGVAGSPLHGQAGTEAPLFPDEFREACEELRIEIEADLTG